MPPSDSPRMDKHHSEFLSHPMVLYNTLSKSAYHQALCIILLNETFNRGTIGETHCNNAVGKQSMGNAYKILRPLSATLCVARLHTRILNDEQSRRVCVRYDAAQYR